MSAGGAAAPAQAGLSCVGVRHSQAAWEVLLSWWAAPVQEGEELSSACRARLSWSGLCQMFFKPPLRLKEVSGDFFLLEMSTVRTLLSADSCSKAPLLIKEKTMGEMAPLGLCFQFSLSMRQNRSQPSLGWPQCCRGVELSVLSWLGVLVGQRRADPI